MCPVKKLVEVFCQSVDSVDLHAFLMGKKSEISLSRQPLGASV